jgi:hypothetical protein
MNEKLCQSTLKYADQPITSITLKIPVELFEHVKKAADLAGSDYQTLINCYVQHGLINSQALVKRNEFAEHAKEVLEKHGVNPAAVTEVFSKFLY